MTPLHQALGEPLRQLEATIDRLACSGDQLQPEWYAEIGVHIRHVWDYYRQLFAAESGSPFDFTRRSRGHPMESDLAEARVAIAATRRRLSELQRQPDDPVEVITDVCAENPTSCRFRSTWGREACYIADHGIHHVAHIVLLLRQHDVELPHRFGYAASTMRSMNGQEVESVSTCAQ